MFLTIECKGPQDREWSMLNKSHIPAAAETREGSAELKRFTTMLYDWQRHYFDHQVRLVKRK